MDKIYKFEFENNISNYVKTKQTIIKFMFDRDVSKDERKICMKNVVNNIMGNNAYKLFVDEDIYECIIFEGINNINEFFIDITE